MFSSFRLFSTGMAAVGVLVPRAEKAEVTESPAMPTTAVQAVPLLALDKIRTDSGGFAKRNAKEWFSGVLGPIQLFYFLLYRASVFPDQTN